jgi:hypothetical protein
MIRCSAGVQTIGIVIKISIVIAAQTIVEDHASPRGEEEHIQDVIRAIALVMKVMKEVLALQNEEVADREDILDPIVLPLGPIIIRRRSR